MLFKEIGDILSEFRLTISTQTTTAKIKIPEKYHDEADTFVRETAYEYMVMCQKEKPHAHVQFQIPKDGGGYLVRMVYQNKKPSHQSTHISNLFVLDDKTKQIVTTLVTEKMM